MMGLISWWKRTTFEGTIRKELGEFNGTSRGKVMKIQELEKKSTSDPRRLRLNFITKTALSYHSTAMAMEEAELRRLVDTINRALSNPD